MKVQTIASGSKGNCTIILCEETKLLIDMGISYLTLKKSLEENSLFLSDFTGILITHCHNDHISGLKQLIKNTHIPCFIPKTMYQSLKDIIPEERCEWLEENNNINNVKIELIHTSHDAPSSVGYVITEEEKSLVYITDTGYINRKFLQKMINKNIYIIESNHDEKMLMDGPYPRFLKERVIKDTGHLSNKQASDYMKKVIGEETKYIVLAHLSETNNTEELAYQTMNEIIKDTNINLIIATQYEPSKMIEI